MDLVSVLRVALVALTRNKMRSILTMLGIIIGVGAVIAMVGVGQGASEQVQARIQAMGSNLLYVQSGSRQAGAVHLGWGQTKTLTYADEQAILAQVPAVRAAAAGATASEQVVYNANNWGTHITGTEPSYFDIRAWQFDQGSTFTEPDVTDANNVAVLGATVVNNLFPDGADPVGKAIRIKNLPFKVVGTLIAKGQSGMGQDQDDNVYVPYTTLNRKITGNYWLSNIAVSAVSNQATAAAQQQITDLLRSRHRIRPGQPDDFAVMNLAAYADVANESAQIMTILLASIASVSLLVGGIGIMNIMLVSVTERTREIGIRMAVGATEADVQRQFLIEALVLALAGGAIGIFFGLGTSWVISAIAQWPVDISPASIVVAAVFSAGIGIFFGFYPAKKAARLDPIEALRFE
ncbi:MAG: FtsX-like permease family protein [Acidobacteria bacterium]|nr:MAG: FtsX-like permease family protein [Acidobacteriota bacterium]